MLGAVQADEVRQRMNRRQTLVACRHTALALFFHLLEKGTGPLGREVLHLEPVNRLASLARNKRQK